MKRDNETAEEAYRRGYCDGYMQGVSDVEISDVRTAATHAIVQLEDWRSHDLDRPIVAPLLPVAKQRQ